MESVHVARRRFLHFLDMILTASGELEAMETKTKIVENNQLAIDTLYMQAHLPIFFRDKLGRIVLEMLGFSDQFSQKSKIPLRV